MKKPLLVLGPLCLVAGCKPRDFNSDALSSASATALHPLERIFKEEERHVAEAVRIAEEGVDNSRKSLGKAGRDAHTKAHGCVRATFTVKDGIPQAYRQGVFAEARTFPAWIRFSTASGEKKTPTAGAALWGWPSS